MPTLADIFGELDNEMPTKARDPKQAKLADLLKIQKQLADKLVNLPTEAQRFITNPQAFTQLLTGKNPLPRETGFAAGATGLPAQQGTILNPEYQAYMQGYEQGEPVSYAAMVAPATVPLAKVLAPKAGQMAENYMVNQGFMPSIVAYHGTPHTIRGKFDINKVGTGEGSQVYGHGMYFAENPKVSEGYRHMLSVDPNVASEKIQFATLEKFANKEKNAVQQQIQAFIDGTGNYNDFVRIINEQGSKQFKNALLKEEPNLFSAGNIYKVDIPDADIPSMLDWDKPLSQQTDAVKKAIKDFELDYVPENLTGGRLIEELNKAFDPETVSKHLSDAGIKGIRYLDEGSRKSGKGTSNFVVFDPSNVKILEQNSKPYDPLEEFIKSSGN